MIGQEGEAEHMTAQLISKPQRAGMILQIGG